MATRNFVQCPRPLAALSGLASLACVSPSSATIHAPPPPTPQISTYVAPAQMGFAPPAAAAPAPSSRKLTLPEARAYMLALINRDRATMNLPPVLLDQGAAQVAGQAHAEDMASLGYLGHWGSDGSVPEQRFTEAGGVDMDLENASCVVDQQRRAIDPTPYIDPREIEKTESMFFNETPPNDGHRKNILKPWHTRVGIGIAQTMTTATEYGVPCVSQEFVDSYATYAPIPMQARVGQVVHVEGATFGPATIAAVGVARTKETRPIAVDALNAGRSYLVPPTYQTYWPKGYVTPIPLLVQGSHFSIDVPLSDRGEAGLYEVSVWAKFPGSQDIVMIGLRTVRVTR